MPSRISDRGRLGRVGWAIVVSLLALAILAGFWPIIGVLIAWVPLLAVPAAAGLPNLIPALRILPLGETTWVFWAADAAGVIVMLLTAWAMLIAPKRQAAPSPARAFGRGVWVTTVAIVAGNIVRAIFTSFVVHADLGTYLGHLVANVVVSALLGAILGLVVGAVAALVAIGGRGRADASSETSAETAPVGADAQEPTADAPTTVAEAPSTIAEAPAQGA